METLVQIGSVDATLVPQPVTDQESRDDISLGRLDAVALQIPPPRKSENFLAPVNGVGDADPRALQL